jgi:hypothetical protein
LLGVIAFAYAIEEVVAHPDEPLTFAIRLSLALGLILFTGGMAAAMWRAAGAILWTRVIVILMTAVVILLISNVIPIVTLAIAFLGIVTIAVLEQKAGAPLNQ